MGGSGLPPSSNTGCGSGNILPVFGNLFPFSFHRTVFGNWECCPNSKVFVLTGFGAAADRIMPTRAEYLRSEAEKCVLQARKAGSATAMFTLLDLAEDLRRQASEAEQEVKKSKEDRASKDTEK
jgi:hypothetical protein